ncbi:MAG: MBL fold metallo-hydrolase [Candidatus Aenigmarchaeota archaeon]|nr:MBL fold metallo-hydrolase [Candidatus Aenigmarchaeota archaeon]
MKILSIEVELLGHDSVKIKTDKIIYIDPFKIKPEEKADFIFVTHEHFDHCSSEDIKKLIKKDTVLVGIPSCKDSFDPFSESVKEIIYMRPNEKKTIEGMEIETVPAYNTNKFKEPGKPFHPKEDGKVGYILNIQGKRIYHAGDTDVIDEMKSFGKIDIAFLPVSGTYVMTSEEAVKAVDLIKPQIAIPVHYNKIVGTRKDAEKFKSLAKCEVVVL